MGKIQVTTLQYILKKFNLEDRTAGRMPIEIFNYGRNNLAGLFNELNFNIGVEIGVFKGEYSEILCKANSKLKMYCIDPWKANPDLNEYEDFNQYYEIAKKRLSRYNCELINSKNELIVDNFKDNSIDFVYIDGDHRFQSVINDITNWKRVVRPGGIISGHDYNVFKGKLSYIDVIGAVHHYTLENKINPWFVLGSRKKYKNPNIVRDHCRSWMWVNNK